MKKSIMISNILTFFVLGYYAIVKGLDCIIGLALTLSAISNAINIVYEVRYGRKEK